jgi:ribosomal protein S3
MGFFSGFASTAKAYGKKAIDVAKNAALMYDKAKGIYTNIKDTVSNLPVVGNIASNLINKGENFVNEQLMKRTGMNASDIDQKIHEARTTAGNYGVNI